MRSSLSIPIFTAFLSFLAFPCIAQNSANNVYEGIGNCVGTDTRDVERCALEEAKKDALDKAGTFIQASSKVSMFQLTESEINSFAAGLVKVIEKDVKTEYDSVLHVLKSQVVIKAEIDNRTVQEGIESFAAADSSLSKLKNEEKMEAGKLQFEFTLVGKRRAPDGSLGKEIIIGEDTTLTAGDLFQVIFKASRDCYVYMINIDSRGKIFKAFPNEENGLTDNRLAADNKCILPSPGLYYELDDNPGVETLYFLGSLEPMDDISFILKRLKVQEGESGDGLAARGLLDERVAHRGIARITEHPGESTQNEDPTKILEGYGSLTMKTVFQHR